MGNIEKIGRMEGWHFWFQGRNILVKGLLKKYLPPEHTEVADLGCGTGSMVRWLLEQNLAVKGIDLQLEGLRELKGHVPEADLILADVLHLPLKDGEFGGVTLLDVLEHVDDRKLLREINRVLGKGAVLILTVPAMPWLWSHRDRSAGHLRRYSRRHLVTLLRSSGFRVSGIFYYQFFLFPLLVLSRWAGKKRLKWMEREEKISPLVNGIFRAITVFEVAMGKVINWPWGSSLVGVCYK